MDKKSVIAMLHKDFETIDRSSLAISEQIASFKEETIQYIRDLLLQIEGGNTPLLTKTPKVSKKKGTRIKAIPENSEIENDSSFSNSSISSQLTTGSLEISDIRSSRPKRGALIKAADNIKKQQSIAMNTKLRRPSNTNDEVFVASKTVQESRSKRTKDKTSSLEDENTRPLKHMKVELEDLTKTRTIDETHVINDTVVLSEVNESSKLKKSNRTSVKRKLDDDEDEDVNSTMVSDQSTRQDLFVEPAAKKANTSKCLEKNVSAKKKLSEKLDNIVNETMDMANETVGSVYEDAVGKPYKSIKIMNSTMNPHSTVTIEQMMNAAVLIEPLSTKKIFNETVVVKKNSFKESIDKTSKVAAEEPEFPSDATFNVIKKGQKVSSVEPQNGKKIDKFSELITDDESSPERKEYRAKKEKMLLKKEKPVTRASNNSLTSDDEVLLTPTVKIPHKDYKGSALKSVYKQGALFSPYAKSSVKTKIEAFEQVVGSPKQEVSTAGRVTRTKTRALAATTFIEEKPPSVAQQLAKKSLGKAKRISLARQKRENEETKENEASSIPILVKKTSSLEKSAQKMQSKTTTPLGKSRLLQMPNSVSKPQYGTPSNSQYYNNYAKSMTGPRGNIVTHVDSFIQPIKSASKVIDRTADEKRKRMMEEDVKKKREELLKAKAEEKKRRREEKELKNKLAREAKQKLELEKRLKAEKEREEKAKIALQIQEKQKEELERKRIAQIRKAAEKEERRKQEELMRLQRLQEQEEQERLLAEQKRREQEMEKRKQAELRHLAEMKMKGHLADKAAMQAKAKMAKKQVENYKIDSDPDEDDSDDESKPKHAIPVWAEKHARQPKLAMQLHIPMKYVLRFFDAKKCTPDLREFFVGIDPKKLKRSSSAIWKTPPRYSMMNCSIIKD